MKFDLDSTFALGLSFASNAEYIPFLLFLSGKMVKLLQCGFKLEIR